MVRMVTNIHQVARRDVRIARSTWRLRQVLGLSPDRKWHPHSRLTLSIAEYTRFTARSMGYVRHDYRTQCSMHKDRIVKRRLLAQCTRYAFPGGYLIVALTAQGNQLCPDCACVNDRDNPDDRIVDRTTIDYVTDGWTPEDDEYEPALCDGCNRDMGKM